MGAPFRPIPTEATGWTWGAPTTLPAPTRSSLKSVPGLASDCHMTEWRIPLSDVDLDASEEDAVLRVVRSGWLTAGAEVQAFEREFADFLGVQHAVGLANCTAALHLACVALGVRNGVEVIVPTLTFV